jgi:hypothetical protein
MREVRCPHCNVTNRRPKCGSCQKEIVDPPAVELVWKLYEHRKVVAVTSVLLALTAFYLLYPGDISDCREQAARTARTNDALHILIRVCNDKFPSHP